MDDKAKAEKNAYMKAWRDKNKDKVKAAQERYWNKRSRDLKKEAWSNLSRKIHYIRKIPIEGIPSKGIPSKRDVQNQILESENEIKKGR